MKKLSILRPLALTTLAFYLMISGCQKDKESVTLLESSELHLKLESKSYISNFNYNINSDSELTDFGNLTPTELNNLTEVTANSLLEPLVNSGSSLYSDMLTQIVGTNEWNNLSSEEQSYILNFTPQQKAMLQLLFKAANTDLGPSSGQTPKWVNCGIAALGFEQAYGLFARAFTIGMSATTAIQVLKFVGLKYLGYIALAVAVYEFVECINSTGSPEGGEGNDGSGSTLGNGNQAQGIYLPTPLPSNIYYKSNQSLLYTSTSPQAPTSIFFNSVDKKYYSDSNFQTFVPNGYYDSPSEIAGSSNGYYGGTLHKYYHIINGEVTEAIIVDFDNPMPTSVN